MKTYLMSKLRKYSNVLLLKGAAATKNLSPHLFNPNAVLTFSKTSLFAILNDNESLRFPVSKSNIKFIKLNNKKIALFLLRFLHIKQDTNIPDA